MEKPSQARPLLRTPAGGAEPFAVDQPGGGPIQSRHRPRRSTGHPTQGDAKRMAPSVLPLFPQHARGERRRRRHHLLSLRSRPPVIRRKWSEYRAWCNPRSHGGRDQRSGKDGDQPNTLVDWFPDNLMRPNEAWSSSRMGRRHPVGEKTKGIVCQRLAAGLVVLPRSVLKTLREGAPGED